MFVPGVGLGIVGLTSAAGGVGKAWLCLIRRLIRLMIRIIAKRQTIIPTTIKATSPPLSVVPLAGLVLCGLEVEL